jgi:hypothetical protein
VPAANAALPPVALGIVLGGRGVGLAVATRGSVLGFRVVDLHKNHGPEAKEARFRNAVAGWIDGHGVTRIAVVGPLRGEVHLPVVRDEAAWLVAEAQARGIALAFHDSGALRERYARGGRPSNRAMGERLAAEFPELRGSAASSEPVPGADRVPGLRRRIRSEREKYYARAFLALAAAMADLDWALLALRSL